MNEAFVRLPCAVGEKGWEATPTDLPAPDAAFTCPGCDAERRTAEFMRTGRDLEVLTEMQTA